MGFGAYWTCMNGGNQVQFVSKCIYKSMLGSNAQFEFFLFLLFVDEFMFLKGQCTNNKAKMTY
jgi:hypothetical protein